jgi:hypothetical protein
MYMLTVASIITSSNHSASPPSATKHKRLDVASDKNVMRKCEPVELQVLFLPSEISAKVLGRCHPGLDEIKRQLRDAQC